MKDQQASYKKFYYRKYNTFIIPLSERYCFGDTKEVLEKDVRFFMKKLVVLEAQLVEACK